MGDGKVHKTSTSKMMFHKATNLSFKEGTLLEVEFQTGEVKQYDISILFPKYPQLKALLNRELFISGRLMGSYGIFWDEEIDLEIETVYEDGTTVVIKEISAGIIAGDALAAARAEVDMSQKELAEISGIDQSDISKIERGIANPSVNTLNRIAKAMGMKLNISFK